MVFQAGGGVRTIRRFSILTDVQDVASARLAAINGAAMKAENSLRGTQSAARGVSGAFKAAALGAVAGLMALRSITSVGTNLQTTFATVEETMSATTEQMDAMRERTQELGREMPVTMGETAEAFKEFAFAGFEAEEAVRASQAAVELAVAGQMDMADATKQVGQMMNAFGIDADNTAQAVSSMTATFANSAIELEELGSAMRYASASMNMLGFSVTETNAALGTMADAGIQGTMAGTALNQAFNQLVSGSGNVENAMSALGLTIDDITDKDGEMLPMVEVLGILDERIEQAGISGAGLQELLADLFGQRGARAMGPLLDQLDEFEDKLETSAFAQLKTANEEMDEFTDRELMEQEILFHLEDEDLDAYQQMLDDIEDDEGIEDIHERIVGDGEMPDEPIDQIMHLREQYQQGAMEMEEIAHLYEEVFGLEDEAARQLADMTTDEEVEMAELEEGLENATTQAELAEAQMDTVGGRLRWMRGTMESVAYTMFTGFAPALELLLDLFVAVMETLSGNERLLQGLGLALFFATGALTAYTIAKLQAIAAAIAFPAVVGGVTSILDILIKKLLFGGIAFHQLGDALVRVLTGKAGLKAFVAPLKLLVGVLGGPFVVAIMLAVAALYAWHTNLFGVRDAMEPVIEVISSIISALVRLAKWLHDMPMLFYLVAAAVAVLLGPVGLLGGALIVLIPLLARTIGWLSGLVGVSVDLSSVWSLLMTLGSQFVQLIVGIGQAFRLAGQDVEAWASTVGDALMWFFSWLQSLPLRAGRWIMDALAQGIKEGGPNLLKVMAHTIYEAILGPLLGLLNPTVQGIGSRIIGDLIRGILSGASELFGLFSMLGDLLVDGLLEIVELLPDEIAALFDPFAELVDYLETGIELLTNLDRLWFDLGDFTAEFDVEMPSLEGLFLDEEGRTLGEQWQEELEEEFDIDIPDGENMGRDFVEAILGEELAEAVGGTRDGDDDSGDDEQPSVEPQHDLDAGLDAGVQQMSARDTSVTHDDRTLHVEMNPTIEINGEAAGGQSTDQIDRMVRRGMDQARRDALDDLIDFIMIGGPADVADGPGPGDGTDSGPGTDGGPGEDDEDDDFVDDEDPDDDPVF